MINLVRESVKREILKLNLKEKMTGHLVDKKKRGTYQALEECSREEVDIIEEVTKYVESWLGEQLTNGQILNLLNKEVKNQVILELSRRGFTEVIRKI